MENGEWRMKKSALFEDAPKIFNLLIFDLSFHSPATQQEDACASQQNEEGGAD
jgi:hypothetical protein